MQQPIPFQELHAREDTVRIRGTEVRIASIPDLIAMKRAAGRPQDLQDVEALEEILQARREGDV